METDFSGLNNFRKKIVNLNKCEKAENKILDYGVKYAKSCYAGKDFDVKKEPHKIVASGDGIAFEEFGTGFVGYYSNYPYKALPTQDITFKSRNKLITTKGWIYYYPNKATKRVIKQKSGWFKPGGDFTEGSPAYAEMWNTSVAIRLHIKEIIKNLIKGSKN